MTKQRLLTIMCGIYCAAIVVSNVIVGKQIGVGAIAVNTAMVLFPVSYIINDVTVEIFGYRTAKTVIWTGFLATLLAVVSYSITLAIPGAESFTNQEAFEIVLGNTPRVFLASMAGYLCGAFANARIMTSMKSKWEKNLFARCIGSTIIGETLDAVVFYILAFSFVLPVEVIASLIISASIIKTAFEAIMYPITKRVISKVKALPEI